MPIQLDYGVSRARFREALAVAKSDAALPKEWLERTRQLGTGPNKTFIAMLGTALLAKATDARVDPFALKVRDFPAAYSARSLCKDVLVPCAVENRIHLGTTGREPLNNQPFFRHERVSRDMVVHQGARKHLHLLCEALDTAKTLDASKSLSALAAFLRARLEGGPRRVAFEFSGMPPEFSTFMERTAKYVTRNPESGKRGQALVAACFSLVFSDVRTSRVFDPSRHWPGDIAVFEGRNVTRVIEVKQRPATETEILQFIEKSRAAGVARVVVTLLDPLQADLAVGRLSREAWERWRVFLVMFKSVAEIIHASIEWTAKPLEQALLVLPRLVGERLQELEVSEKGLQEWLELFGARG